MNQRIRELAKEATSTVSVNHEGYRVKRYTEQVEVFDKEKFAELIVRECVNRVRSRQQFATEDNQNVTQAFDLLVYDIESHFGVEE